MRRCPRCSNYKETAKRLFAENCRRISTRKSKNSEHDRERSTQYRTTHSDALTITSQATSRDQLINDVSCRIAADFGPFRSSSIGPLRPPRPSMRRAAALALHAPSVYMIIYRRMRSCTIAGLRSRVFVSVVIIAKKSPRTC